MKPINVGVIDYGMGNLHSVSKALALQGARVTVTNSKSKLKDSQLVVLPGVGAFGAAMEALKKKKLDDFVRQWISDKKSYLGICLGFQLLFDSSEESKGVKGLGVFKGPVVSFRAKDFGKASFNIPHMGWNNAAVANKKGQDYFKKIRPTDSFYFVHTFFPVPKDKNIISTVTPYGKNFCSSVATDRLFASQFHPEKSGKVGMQLVKNILQQARAS